MPDDLRARWGPCLLTALLAVTAAPLQAAVPLEWCDSYSQAVSTAAAEGRRVLLFFHAADAAPALDERLDAATSDDPALVGRLAEFCLLRLSVDHRERLAGEETRLLEHGALAHLGGRPGLAVLDVDDEKEAADGGQVLSIVPFADGKGPEPRDLQILVDLPDGTLTQRTLIFAVRAHPDGPHSTAGECSALLAAECEQHSLYQAQIRRQGHHRWSHRFHRINARLPRELVAQEVCAESWPDMELFEAAVECVHSWRQSSGHWSAVRTRHACFGYDMKRGSNGIWYATGIFGTDR